MFPPLESVQPGQKTQGGVTLVELLIALVVGSIMVSAVYGAYLLVTRQYEKLSAVASLHQTGRAALGLMVRDIRQAGYLTFGSQALAGGVNVVIINRCVGPLGPSVTSTSGCGRSDQITLIYDQDANTRIRVNYQLVVNAGRGQLRTTKQVCTDPQMAICPNFVYQNQVIADNIEDLRFVGRDANGPQDNNPTIVDIELVMRTDDQYQLAAAWANPFSPANTPTPGSSRLSANDGFVREVLQQTVLVRNIAYN